MNASPSCSFPKILVLIDLSNYATWMYLWKAYGH
jgi:hypothetical protein